VAAVHASGALTASNVTEELIGETAWVCEREEMAAWKLVDGEMQSLSCDATLELDREEAIVASGDHVDPDRGPRLESAGLAEDDVSLGALARLALFHDLRWEVVEEVGGEIEARAVATAVRRG
jgi:hypothetical protein